MEVSVAGQEKSMVATCQTPKADPDLAVNLIFYFDFDPASANPEASKRLG